MSDSEDTSAVGFDREHDDPHAAGLPPLLVDRRRIVHAAAFRRLQYKTQVFVARSGDHFRSRMTHTLEVASLARDIAGALGLDADLAEVVALAHDLGHPPFGHAGERALQAALREHHERFEHNEQTLRVVTYLEHPYPEFRGLNLTRAVRACLQSHRTAFDHPGPAATPPPIENDVVNFADQFAYTLHDLQDGLYAGLVSPADLRDVFLWKEAYRGPAAATREDCLRHLRPTVERMEQLLIEELCVAPDPKDASAGGEVRPTVRMSQRGGDRLADLASLLSERVYKDRRVIRMDDKATRVVRAIFDAYVKKPQLMPARFAARVAQDGVARVAADYIAGMTDRFCQDEHARLFDPSMDV